MNSQTLGVEKSRSIQALFKSQPKFQTQVKVEGDKLFKELFNGLSVEKKKEYLKFDYAQTFINELNQIKKGLGDSLKYFFLTAIYPNNWMEIRDLILEKGGFIGPVLRQNPGSAWFMDLLYRYKDPKGPLDKFLADCMSGRAVDYRKTVVIKETMAYLNEDNDEMGQGQTLLNLGSGCGYDAFEIAKQFPGLRISNVDNDPEVVETGNIFLRYSKSELRNVSFICSDMAKAGIKKNADLIWVIGVLCSFSQEQSIRYLSLFRKRYMKKGGVLFGACVTAQMVNRDLFTSFVLEEILNWHLNYRDYFDVKEIFEKAGFKWRQDLVFSESEDKFYIIGAGEN